MEFQSASRANSFKLSLDWFSLIKVSPIKKRNAKTSKGFWDFDWKKKILINLVSNYEDSIENKIHYAGQS